MAYKKRTHMVSSGFCVFPSLPFLLFGIFVSLWCVASSGVFVLVAVCVLLQHFFFFCCLLAFLLFCFSNQMFLSLFLTCWIPFVDLLFLSSFPPFLLFFEKALPAGAFFFCSSHVMLVLTLRNSPIFRRLSCPYLFISLWYLFFPVCLRLCWCPSIR